VPLYPSVGGRYFGRRAVDEPTGIDEMQSFMAHVKVISIEEKLTLVRYLAVRCVVQRITFIEVVFVPS